MQLTMSTKSTQPEPGAGPAAAAAPDDVLEAVHAVMHLVKHRQHDSLREHAPGLTPLEGRVLGFFVRRPGATLSELVEHAGRDKGQLARLVNGLKERGLLDVRPDEADRRVSRLHPTEAALAQHRAVMRWRKRLAELAAAGFSADERAQLLALLGKLRANLEAAD